MFRISVIVFGTVVCQCFSPWTTMAETPNDSNHYDNSMTLSRRLDELAELRTKDIKRIGDLVTRVTELEELRAKDLSTMTIKMKELEDGYTTDKLEMIKRVTELEHIISNNVQNMNTIEQGGMLGLEDPHGKNITVIDTDEHPVNGPSNVINDDSNLSKKDMKYPTRFRDSPAMNDARHTRRGPNASIILFHARLSSRLTSPWIGQTIIFNQVVTNIGSNYNPLNGVFGCTQAGGYVFSWTIRHNYSHWVYTELVKNGDAIAFAYVGDKDYSTTGSATAAVSLNTGDVVLVRVSGLSSAAQVYETHSIFTGFRIQ